MSDDMNNTIELMKDDFKIFDDTARVDLFYPRNSSIKYFVLGLCDVRAADDIRMSYDFDRDGWIIEQASTFQWDINDKECDPDWKEVAFVQVWGREKK